MRGDIMITAITCWLAATNEPIVVEEWNFVLEEMLEQIQLRMDSGSKVFVLVLVLKAAQNTELGIHVHNDPVIIWKSSESAGSILIMIPSRFNETRAGGGTTGAFCDGKVLTVHVSRSAGICEAALTRI